MADEDTGKQAQRNIEVESRLTGLETRFDTILPTLATKADLVGLGVELRAEFMPQFEALRSQIGDVRVELHKLDASIKTWMLATLLTVIGTMLAAIIGLNQINKGAAPAQPPIIINLPGGANAPAPAPR